MTRVRQTRASRIFPPVFLAAVCSALLTTSALSGCHSAMDHGGGNTTPAGVSGNLAAKAMGTYTGSLDNKDLITLVINYISGKTVSGYDIHKGLRRNVNGELT